MVGAAAKVGFIGLGNMGGHMAMNLLRKGFGVVVYDLNKGVCSSHACAEHFKSIHALAVQLFKWGSFPCQTRRREPATSKAKVSH